MSVTIDWMDARYSVVHANFMDNWDWSEWYQALDFAHHLMSNSQRSITLMLDLVGSQKLAATNTLRSIPDDLSAPDNLIRIILITTDDQLGKKMVNIMHDIYPNLDDIILTKNHQSAFENVRSTVEMQAVTG